MSNLEIQLALASDGLEQGHREQVDKIEVVPEPGCIKTLSNYQIYPSTEPLLGQSLPHVLVASHSEQMLAETHSLTISFPTEIHTVYKLFKGGEVHTL